MGESGSKPIFSQIGPLLLLVWIFLLNFLSRIIFSPLLPTIEKDLAIGHGEAGSLFLLLSLGYCIMLVASGFVTSRVHHKRTIALSAIVMAASLFAISLSQHLWEFRVGLFSLGLSAGLYLPSGIATITDLVRSEDWGKAIAIHEFAPNLGFVVAPLVADVFLEVLAWREILGGLGVVSLFSGLVFIRLGRGGSFCGEPPKTGTLRTIVALPSFWIMTVIFSLSIGSSFGVYSMLPLYLISERGLESRWANALVGLSRIPTVGAPILAGWFTDRLGPKRTLGLLFLVAGTCAILLGLLDGSWMIAMVFLQPMVASALFPPAFTALARLGSSALKNVIVSLVMPVGFLLGGGGVPAALGFIGEWRSFSLGIMLFGGIVLGGAVLSRRLRFREE